MTERLSTKANTDRVRKWQWALTTERFFADWKDTLLRTLPTTDGFGLLFILFMG
jgi:hypothetical protein